MILTATRPLVYLITKGEARADNFDDAAVQILNIVRVAVKEKVELVQVREKSLTTKLLLQLVRAVVRETRNSETKVMVNDRFDLALAAGADGVHLTSTSMLADLVKSHIPADMLIGVSTHNEEEVARASNSADFILFGPVFESPGKPDTQGLEKLSDICDRSTVPVVAIGGIDSGNVDDVIAAGASGVAAIRAFNDPEILREVVRVLRR